MARQKRVIWKKEDDALSKMRERYDIRDVDYELINPYCFNVMIPFEYGDEKVMAFATDLFHELELLDEDDNMDFSGSTAFCDLVKDEDMECYCVIFNHHDVLTSEPGDDLYQYTVEAMCEEGEDNEDDDATWMQEIADCIKSGEIKSKTGEGFFVLKGEYFDEIKAGRKTTEYRDFSPSNLPKSIGVKTVKLQRGYTKEQMRYEVKSVGLLDADDRECDPFDIPKGFFATTIAIHLGNRIG